MLKILIAGNDENYMAVDQIRLHDHGFHVFKTLSLGNITELAAEIKPNVIYLNFQKPEQYEFNLFTRFLKNEQLTHLPVVFALEENEAYLVNTSRCNKLANNSCIATELLPAMKLALSKQPEMRTPYINAFKETFNKLSAIK